MTRDETTGRARGGRCGSRLRRRRPVARRLGQMSAAVLAAMVGVALRPETAAARCRWSRRPARQTGADERTYPLPAADGVTIDRDTQVIVVRFQQHVYAFNLACPHENTALRWKDSGTAASSVRATSRSTSPTARSSRAARRATWTASP